MGNTKSTGQDIANSSFEHVTSQTVLFKNESNHRFLYQQHAINFTIIVTQPANVT